MIGSHRISKVSQQSQNVVENPCLRCNNDVTGDDHGIQCEYCERWLHSKCADLNESAYKAISAVPGFK